MNNEHCDASQWTGLSKKINIAIATLFIYQIVLTSRQRAGLALVCYIPGMHISGNILLNISLAESIPLQRMGKNNVTLVCVPNPPMEVTKGSSDASPVMLLIRVKTEEDADELYNKLTEHKNK